MFVFLVWTDIFALNNKTASTLSCFTGFCHFIVMCSRCICGHMLREYAWIFLSRGCICVWVVFEHLFSLINPKHSSSNLVLELPAQPKEMRDNARTVISAKTAPKCSNLLSSVKATITDVIEVVWFTASQYEIMAETSVSPQKIQDVDHSRAHTCTMHAPIQTPTLADIKYTIYFFNNIIFENIKLLWYMKVI